MKLKVEPLSYRKSLQLSRICASYVRWFASFYQDREETNIHVHYTCALALI